jgi:DEAD/DEAH box helicase domain-containing protein
MVAGSFPSPHALGWILPARSPGAVRLADSGLRTGLRFGPKGGSPPRPGRRSTLARAPRPAPSPSSSGLARFLEAVEREDALWEALRHHEVLAERPPVLAECLPRGYEAIAEAFATRGIGGLYDHQARAIAHLEAGRNVALATPTASGKTLVYNWPLLHQLQSDPESRALYLFPLKALERDQRDRLREDLRALGLLGERFDVEIYDGDTPQSRRRKLRTRPPSVLITTPDMLHMGILPHHEAWKPFFEKLRTVVIDEVHTYRGIFGSHVAQVLRRLERVARFHGAAPRYVAASATISNPGELAGTLTGRPFEVVQRDGSPKTRRHVLLFQPRSSPYTLAAQLFRQAVSLGLRTIAFTKARVITELMYTWIVDADPDLAPRISSYRAGFLPEERREIEARLFSGELHGVISTSALEMGIDVGGLDVCILVGYPGSQVATWQRGGRVGRERQAAIALVAQPDALDQYLVTHPKAFFEREFEHAVTDAHNSEVAGLHLACAAAELPLVRDEAWLREPEAAARVAELETEGALLASEEGDRWFCPRRLPHRDVSLRSTGSSFDIVVEGDGGRPEPIGSIGSGRVYAECHEGAVYLHRGRQFLVRELAVDEQTVRVQPVRASYYTRALSEKETEILERKRARPAGQFRLVEGRVKVTTHLTAYERRHVHGQDLLGTEPLDLPPTSFETTGLWLEIPDEIPDGLDAEGRHPMGSIHAVEHAALALFPLYALCDRHDVAGISHLRHPQLNRSAIFLYDSHPGGMGLVTSLFDRLESLLESTLEMIASCPCEDGCPGCVHSPKCGSGNRPIDKAGAMRALRWLLALDPLPACTPRSPDAPADAADAADAAAEATATGQAPPAPARGPRVVYFDLETQRSAEEVGGWHNAHLMRVALAVVWDSAEGDFRTYREGDVPALLDHLRAADLVVGFNVRRFDYKVLRGYCDDDFDALATFDMLDAIHKRIGFRLKLDHLATETLGARKSADGLQSLQWWKEGRIDEIERYCRQDVALLRDLLAHAETHGHLVFRTRAGERVRLPAPWKVADLVEDVRAQQARLGEPGRRSRR